MGDLVFRGGGAVGSLRMPLIHFVSAPRGDCRSEPGPGCACAQSFVSVIRAVFVRGGSARAPGSGECGPDIVYDDLITAAGNQGEVFCRDIPRCNTYGVVHRVGVSGFLYCDGYCSGSDARECVRTVAVCPGRL